MFKSLLRWMQRDRTFALLATGIIILGIVLFVLVVLLYNPTPTAPANIRSNNAPGSNANSTNAANVLLPTSTSATTTQITQDSTVLTTPTTVDITTVVPSTTVLIQSPNQVTNSPNQGQNPAPPAPPDILTSAAQTTGQAALTAKPLNAQVTATIKR